MKKALFALILFAIIQLLVCAAFAGGTYYMENYSDIEQQYCFSLDGVDYRLPVKFSELAKDGWTIDENYEDIILDSLSYTYAYINKGNNEIPVYFLNGTEGEKHIQDGDIVEMQVDNSVDFSLLNGPQFGNTVKEVLDMYGLRIDYEHGKQTSNGVMWYTMYQDDSIVRDLPDYSYGIDISFALDEQKGTIYSPGEMLTSKQGRNEIIFTFDSEIKDTDAELTAISLQYMNAAE